MTRLLTEIKIEVTYACPLICVHCSSEAYPGSPEQMAPRDVHRVLVQAAEMGVRRVAFSGGEPMLWAGLDNAVETASKLGMETTVYTSGNVPDARLRLDMLGFLGLDRLVFSIFGASAEPHEMITRRRGSLARTMQAVRDSVVLGIPAGLHFVAMTRNYRELPGVCSLSSDLGADGVSVLRFVPQGRGRLLLDGELDRMQSLELRRTIQRLRAEGHMIRTGSPLNHLWLNDEPACMSAIDRLIVAADGRVYPCDAFKQVSAESVAGTAEFSVLGPDCSLEEAWAHSPYLAAVRAAVEQVRDRPCLDCDSLDRCGSGCLAQKMIVDGRLHAGMDPGCLKRKGA